MTASDIPPRLGAKLATFAGLALALAGALASPEGAPVTGMARRIFVPLPDWLVIATSVAAALAAVIFYAMSLSRRRKRPLDDEAELYREPEHVPPLLAALLFVLALTPAVLLVTALLWLNWDVIAGSGVSAEDLLAQLAETAEQPAAPASPLTTGLVGLLALVAGFGSLGLALWLLLADRLGRVPPGTVRWPTPLAAAVEDSLDDLRSEPDARAAIIRIYRNFERALAGAALPRRPWQTPVEFMRIVLGRAALPPGPIESLTRLFELARFSRHPLGAGERDSAWRSLTEIRSALEREQQANAAPS